MSTKEYDEGFNAGVKAAAEAAGDYAWNRSLESGKLKSPAVFTTHTWQDLRDLILKLSR